MNKTDFLEGPASNTKQEWLFWIARHEGTEDVVARAFAGLRADDLRFEHNSKKWRIREGDVWMDDPTQRTLADARDFVREVNERCVGPSREAERMFYRRGKLSFVNAVLRFVQADRRIATSKDDWQKVETEAGSGWRLVATEENGGDDRVRRMWGRP
jgi:hypothetical protein